MMRLQVGFAISLLTRVGVVDTDRVPMLTKVFAVILLFLALSPFTAPFQTSTGNGHDLASIEPLCPLRKSAHARAALAQEAPDASDFVIILAPASLTPVSTKRLLALLSRSEARVLMGDSALATVLRL